MALLAKSCLQPILVQKKKEGWVGVTSIYLLLFTSLYVCFHASVADLSGVQKRSYSPQNLTYLLSGPLLQKFTNL